MRRVGISPKAADFVKEVPSSTDWLATVGERMNVYAGAADPTTAEVPENQWVLYYNTTSSELRVWSNIAGVMLKSAAFT